MPFQPGVSGNPKGRPRGVGKVAKYRALLQSQAEALIQAAIKQALAGDSTALKLCIDRLLPPYRPEAMPISFSLSGTTSLAQMGESVVAAIGNGVLSPDQGASVLQALEGQARLIEMEELEQRISALEAGHGQP